MDFSNRHHLKKMLLIRNDKMLFVGGYEMCRSLSKGKRGLHVNIFSDNKQKISFSATTELCSSPLPVSSYKEEGEAYISKMRSHFRCFFLPLRKKAILNIYIVFMHLLLLFLYFSRLVMTFLFN